MRQVKNAAWASAALCLALTVFFSSPRQAQAEMMQHLLARQADGSYGEARLADQPRVVKGQACVRYNNYWCLKGTKWEGQIRVGEQRLAVFADPLDAARAYAITMKVYRFKHGLKSPRDVVARFIMNPRCLKAGAKAKGCAHMWSLVDKYSRRIAAALDIKPTDDMAIFKDHNTVDIKRARILFRETAHIEIGTTLRIKDTVVEEGIKRAGFNIVSDKVEEG